MYECLFKLHNKLNSTIEKYYTVYKQRDTSSAVQLAPNLITTTYTYIKYSRYMYLFSLSLHLQRRGKVDLENVKREGFFKVAFIKRLEDQLRKVQTMNQFKFQSFLHGSEK